MPTEKERLGFSLNEFLEFESKELYLQTLCIRAASICIGGKFKDTLKRLEKLFKADINHNHKNVLIELSIKRNNIVHENKEYEITNNYFEDIKESLNHLLDFIKDNLKELGVTVYDPINDYDF